MSREGADSARWQHMGLLVPNETRLQELHALAQRKQAQVPGPGTYEVAALTAIRPCSSSHRRQHQSCMDGPFPLSPGETSLRAQQISSDFILKDSGISPAAYDGLMKKDVCMTRAPTPKIGTERRAGDPIGPKSKLCLSISRSLSSGLNWAKPVSLQQLQQQLICGSFSTASAKHRDTTPHQHGLVTGDVPDVSHHHTSVAQHEVTAREVAHQRQSAGSQPRASVRGPQHQQRHLQQHRTGGVPGVGSSNIPLQLAQSLADWQQVQAAVRQQLQQQQPDDQQQEQQGSYGSRSAASDHGCYSKEMTTATSSGSSVRTCVKQHCRPTSPTGSHQLHNSTATWQSSMQQCCKATASARCNPSKATQHIASGCLTKRRASLLLDEQEVLQHLLAARAADTVEQLAARRERWQQLSKELL